MDDIAGAGPVVVGVDADATTPLAVRWAVAHALANQLPVRLVAAYRPQGHLRETPPDDGLPAPPQQDWGPRRAAMRHLEAARVVAAAAGPGLAVEVAGLPGTAADVLLHEARSASLVVVGSRRLRPVHRLFSGSTGVETAEEAPCPVVVVRETPRPMYRAHRVVVGVDDRSAGAHLRYAFEAARRAGLGLTVVHCWQLSPVDFGDLVTPEVSRQELGQAAMRHVDSMVRPFRTAFPQVDVRLDVTEALAADRLEALSLDASLVVVGVGRLSPKAGMLLGSVSNAVVRRAHCPVVVVPSPEGAQGGSPRTTSVTVDPGVKAG